MRVLMVSDLHYSKGTFHGLDESKSFDWFYEIVKKERPELTLSAGDFGREADFTLFQKIVEETHLLTVYGNHDDIGVIKYIVNKDGSKCWLEDDYIRQYKGLRIAGINGNIAKIKRKVHHKTVEEIQEIISNYAEKKIDVLITHEAPEHELITREKMLGYPVINEAIERIKPKLHLCGHVHIPSQILRINDNLSINLDSSIERKEYALAESKNGKISDVKIVKAEAYRMQ